MVRCVVSVVCALSVLLLPAFAQTTALEPLRYAAGTILDFHLQTRFRPEVENETDLLPKGTVLRVKLLSAVDSDSARDGSEIRGVVTSPVLSGDKVVVHPDADAQVLFVVLRNRTHPQGFRYELLVTQVTDGGKAVDLTASLSSSFADGPPAPSPNFKPDAVPALGTSNSTPATAKRTEKAAN